jgi:hypothetical protein
LSDLFESLKVQIEKDCGYRIAAARLEIGGYGSK